MAQPVCRRQSKAECATGRQYRNATHRRPVLRAGKSSLRVPDAKMRIHVLWGENLRTGGKFPPPFCMYFSRRGIRDRCILPPRRPRRDLAGSILRAAIVEDDRSVVAGGPRDRALVSSLERGYAVHFPLLIRSKPKPEAPVINP